eukprot:scaffold50540_cov18-Tisochrysis_lutea.AAC.2
MAAQTSSCSISSTLYAQFFQGSQSGQTQHIIDVSQVRPESPWYFPNFPGGGGLKGGGAGSCIAAVLGAAATLCFAEAVEVSPTVQKGEGGLGRRGPRVWLNNEQSCVGSLAQPKSVAAQEKEMAKRDKDTAKEAAAMSKQAAEAARKSEQLAKQEAEINSINGGQSHHLNTDKFPVLMVTCTCFDPKVEAATNHHGNMKQREASLAQKVAEADAQLKAAAASKVSNDDCCYIRSSANAAPHDQQWMLKCGAHDSAYACSGVNALYPLQDPHAKQERDKQEPHAKQVQELLAAQEAVANERIKLEALQNELKARRAEVVAQEKEIAKRDKETAKEAAAVSKQAADAAKKSEQLAKQEAEVGWAASFSAL